MLQLRLSLLACLNFAWSIVKFQVNSNHNQNSCVMPIYSACQFDNNHLWMQNAYCNTLENYLINNIIEVILRLFKIKISNPILNKPTNNTLSSESWFSLIHSQQIESNALSICCYNFRISKLERKWHTNYISKCILRGMSYRQWIRLHPAILSWSHMLKKTSERDRDIEKSYKSVEHSSSIYQKCSFGQPLRS